MKRILAAVSLFGLLTVMAFTAHGQVFVNLYFEDAVVQPTIPFYGWLDWNLAAPGWSHSSGADTYHLFYQHGHLAGSQIYYLVDSTSPVNAPGALDDQYSLAFASGYMDALSPSADWVNAYISQTGLIPGGTKSLQLLATGPFTVSVGGVNIPMVSLGDNLYGGDVSAFAGNVTELKIINTSPVGLVQNLTTVDDITFSPMAVPEPSGAGLATMVTMAMLVRRIFPSIVRR